MIDLAFLDHDWAPIEMADYAEPVAYVCQRCGEHRPRGVMVARPGDVDRQRTKLVAAGYQINESPFIPAGTAQVFDGRIWPALDQTMFCVGQP
jgi:hypothetical protein